MRTSLHARRFSFLALTLALLAVSYVSCPLFARVRVQGYVEQGGMRVNNASILSITRSGTQLTNPYTQQSYPSATVDVYLAGTTTHATIYDSAGVAKSNSFAAEPTGYYYFYTDVQVDTKFSGGGIITPYTIYAVAPLATSSTSSVISVADAPYSATGDGVTDDRAAINNAISACAASVICTEVTFPPGTYFISAAIIYNRKSHVRITGAGMYSSIITSSTPGIYLFNVTGATRVTDITFRDLGLQLSGGITLNGIDGDGSVVAGELKIERCRFYGQTFATMVNLLAISSATITDCIFHGGGKNLATGISVGGCGRNVHISGNRFEYLKQGIAVISAGGVVKVDNSEQFTIGPSNYFDGGWSTNAPDFSGSGGTVTYTATDITDSTAPFSGVTAGVFVRAMGVLRNSSNTVFTGLKVTDSTAAWGVTGRRNYIVKSGTKIAVVDEIESNTVLDVDGWLDATTRTPTTAPVDGSNIILYQVVYGQISSSTSTTLTVPRWFTVDGISTTPSNGTLYEVCVNLPNNSIQIGRSAHEIQIFGNRLRRSWGDQIQVFGDRAQVYGNIIEDGADMGITFDSGTGGLASTNTIRRQGTHCIVMAGSSGNTIVGNVCSDAMVISASLTNTGAFVVNTTGTTSTTASNNLITTNRCELIASVNQQLCVEVYAASGTCSTNAARNNTSTGHLYVYPFLARGANADLTYFTGNLGGLAAFDTSATNTRTDNSVTATWNPGSADACCSTTSAVNATFSIAGLTVGRPIHCSLSTLNSISGVNISCIVYSTDTASVTIFNTTSGAVDLASGTLTVESEP